jgi:hypothetical protein
MDDSTDIDDLAIIVKHFKNEGSRIGRISYRDRPRHLGDRELHPLEPVQQELSQNGSTDGRGAAFLVIL